MRPRLAVFDLDGTLTRTETSVLGHLAGVFGFAPAADWLSARYADGTMSNAEVSEAAAGMLRGRTWHELHEALATLPMVDGIAETVAALEGSGVECAISTITFDFAARYVAYRYGFRRVSATRLQWSARRRLTGRVAEALEAGDKCCFVARACDELGITMRQVVVVGDARSDIPAIEAAGFSVGFNPTAEVARVASATVRGSTDLRDVLAHIGPRLSG